MHHRRKFTVGLFVLSLLATSLLIHPVHAATTSQNITVTPSSTAMAIAPGATVKESFDAINEGSVPFSISVTSSPYYVVGVNYDPQFKQLPGTVNAAAWVHFSDPTTQTLTAHKLTSLDYTVTVPAGTPAGGYYAVIFTETSPIASNGGVVSHNRVGDILYITVKGNIKTSGSVTGGALPFIHLDNSVPISVFVSNTGGTYFVSDTEIGVTNLFGKTIFSASSSRYVLSETQREISTTWMTNSPIGIYKVTRSSTVGGVVKALPIAWVFIIQRWVLATLIFIVILIVTIIVLRSNRKSA